MLSLWYSVWILYLGVFFCSLGMFSSVILLKLWSLPLMGDFSPSLIPIIQRYDLFMVSCVSCMFLSCFLIFIFFAYLTSRCFTLVQS